MIATQIIPTGWQESSDIVNIVEVIHAIETCYAVGRGGRKMSHVGCKHLDYETNYEDCKIVTIEPEGWKYWERGKRWTEDGNPKNVQFCKKRGRINNIFQCINPGEMSCYEACPIV